VTTIDLLETPTKLTLGTRSDAEYAIVGHRLVTEAKRLAELHPGAASVLKASLPGTILGRIKSFGKVNPVENMIVGGPPTPFAIIFPEDLPNYPGKPPSAFFVEPRGTMGFRYTEQWHLWYAATLFIHESSHRADVIEKREAHGANPSSMEYLLGEVRAHTIENEIVHLVSDGKWDATVTEILKNPHATHQPQGFRYKLPTAPNMARLLARLPKGQSSAVEATHLEATMKLSVIFAQCKDDHRKAKAYRAFVDFVRGVR